MERLDTIAAHLAPVPCSMTTLPENAVCIVGFARTPLGSFNGSLSSLKASELGSIAIKGALSKANISPLLVEEIIMGNVLSAGMGQAPAKQAALGAGISENCPCTTINKVCSSGMKAIMFGAQSIELGQNQIVVAGGMESMSQVPYLLPKVRTGLRMGNAEIVDGMVQDGLWDPYNHCHMGVAAERCAETHGFTREQQDEYSLESFRRAIHATTNGLFREEIVPVEVTVRRKTSVVTEDEELAKIDLDKIPSLRPAFETNGTVTAANASSISDGAAAVVLCSAKMAKEYGWPIRAVIRGIADASQAPMEFTTTPAKAIPLALERAKISLKDVDVFEINEAFSVVSLVNMKILGIPKEKINLHGGGVSIGHPIGCSGCRIVVTLLSILEQQNKSIGVAGICNGGGGASALVIERLD